MTSLGPEVHVSLYVDKSSVRFLFEHHSARGASEEEGYRLKKQFVITVRTIQSNRSPEPTRDVQRFNNTRDRTLLSESTRKV